MLTAIGAALLGQVNWRIAAGALAAVALLVGTYVAGFNAAAGACRAREIAQQLAVAQATIARATAAQSDAQVRAAQLGQANEALSQQVTVYADQLSHVPAAAGDSCRLGADDVKRLRSLR